MTSENNSERPELIVVTSPGATPAPETENATGEFVEQPAKVMRIGAMIKQLLEEVRSAPLDEKSRVRLREIYDTSIEELAAGLSPELRGELERLVSPFQGEGAPTDSELRIAQAQLVGWLEGIFHGIQATLFAQQMAARSQIEHLRRPGLPAGPPGGASESDDRPGNYI